MREYTEDISTIEGMMKMPLHTFAVLPNGAMNIYRVPGGWIYESWETKNSDTATHTFIPEPNTVLHNQLVACREELSRVQRDNGKLRLELTSFNEAYLP